MKTPRKLLVGALLIVFACKQSFAQSDISGVGTGHMGFSNTGYYVGWDGSTTFPLNIRHNANQPINFFTSNTQRATILGNGNVGINTTNSFRRFEVRDNTFQLRLSRTTGSAFSEFLSNSNGYLTINTSGNQVGIEVTPTRTLDVGGRARILCNKKINGT